MSANKLREHAHDHSFEAVTARPKPIVDEFAHEEADVGLSVDPDDLGSWALRSAAQEDVTHGRGHSEPLSITDAPPSDAALPGPNFNSMDGIWGQSIDVALANGGVDETRDGVALDDDDDETLDERHQNAFDELVREIDFRQDRVVEASLLDTPTGEGIETIEPEIHDEANESRLTEPSIDDDEDDDAEAEAAPEPEPERVATHSGFYRVPKPKPEAAKSRKPIKKRKASKVAKAPEALKAPKAKAKAKAKAKPKAQAKTKAKVKTTPKAKASVSGRAAAKPVRPRKAAKTRKAAKSGAPKRKKTAKRGKTRR